MLYLNNFSLLNKGTAPLCMDNDRSTNKVRIKEHPNWLISAEEDVCATTLGENVEETSDMDLT